MKNFVQRGQRITFPGSSVVGPQADIKSGDPVVVGRLGGVAVADEVPGAAGPYNDGNIVVELEGVFTISVQSIHHAVAVGETVYINSSTAVVSDDSTAMPYGIALDAVSQYATTAIRVRLFGATPGTLGATTFES